MAFLSLITFSSVKSSFLVTNTAKVLKISSAAPQYPIHLHQAFGVTHGIGH